MYKINGSLFGFFLRSFPSFQIIYLFGENDSNLPTTGAVTFVRSPTVRLQAVVISQQLFLIGAPNKLLALIPLVEDNFW